MAVANNDYKVNKLSPSNTLKCSNIKHKLLHFQSYLRYDLLFHVEFKYVTIFLQNAIFFILKKFLWSNISLKQNMKKISFKSRTGKVEMLRRNYPIHLYVSTSVSTSVNVRIPIRTRIL